MPDNGLDEAKLETLAAWAAGLRGDGRAEVAAAGRAIELLIEEVERLHVLLWDRRLYPADAESDAGLRADLGAGFDVSSGSRAMQADQLARVDSDEVVAEAEATPELDRTLRSRLLRRGRQASA